MNIEVRPMYGTKNSLYKFVLTDNKGNIIRDIPNLSLKICDELINRARQMINDQGEAEEIFMLINKLYNQRAFL